MNLAHPDTRRDYRLNFEQEIRSLNPEQRFAVDQTEGPVLVIAGPGTGKTQILAARIGNILQRTDTQARNILCLTFTENGQVEMRSRLLTLIGPDAYRVHIHTFHSFCNLVIQENISQFGKLGLEAISTLEEMELIHRVMDTMKAGNPLKRYKGDVYMDWRKLANLFSLMKKEAWTPGYLKDRIVQYVAELPDRPEFRYQRAYKDKKAGDLKEAQIKAELERMKSLDAAVDLFDTYQEMLREQSRYTFDDMILWVISAFRNNPTLKAEYQERFLYILVDEFQDTSGSQNQLLTLLTDFWEEPNIFVVGDDDQSIFSFQDANVSNIRDFASRFPTQIRKVVLRENYRSTQVILDTASALIQHNLERIVLDDPTLIKELISSNPSLPVVSPIPEVIRFQDPLQETAGILSRIEALIAAGTSPSGIAVIYRQHRQAEVLATLMTKKLIPINIRRKLDILKLPFVRKILTLLEYISLESREPYSGDDLLFRLLHFDFFGIRPVRVARLSIAVYEKNRQSGSGAHSIRRAISEEVLDQAPGLFDSNENEFRRTSDALEYLIGNTHNLTIQTLFEELVRRAGILTYIMKSPEKGWLIEVLQSLFSFIRETHKKEPDLDVKRLVDILRLMEANEIPVELEKVVSSAEGVTLVTAHGSKGSEFGHVFLMGCNSNFWDDVNGRNRYQFKFPDNLHSSQNAVDPLEESRRLFYVAMTRAKTDLSISYSLTGDRGDKAEKSRFVDEVLETGLEETIPARESLTDTLVLQFTREEKLQAPVMEKEFIDRLLKSFILSVTHLNSFLDCPIRFYYQSLIHVPSAKSEYFTFGSAIHYGLQKLFEKMKEGNGVFPPRELMITEFLNYLRFNRECFTPEQYKRRIEYGLKILPEYYDHNLASWKKNVLVERHIANVTVNGIPISGRLDKIELGDHSVNVVDYKTGNFEKALKKLSPPNENNPLGGDYWRQAVFYKILLDNDHSRKWNVASTEFEFVEPYKDQYRTEKVVLTPWAVEKVTEQITWVWDRIQRHDFYTGCGKAECDWCHFVKDFQTTRTIGEMLEEEAG